jgi:hypothetical protein
MVYIYCMHYAFLTLYRWSPAAPASPGFSTHYLCALPRLYPAPPVWPALTRPYARLCCCHSFRCIYAYIRS